MAKKSKKGKDSESVIKLKKEQEITERLNEQAHAQNIEKEHAPKNQIDISEHSGSPQTKAEKEALVELYKQQNPVKYELKKAALNSWLKQ